MGMVKEVLAPGVKDGEEADARTQMLRIGGDGEQGLRGRAEENTVNGLLVFQSDDGNLFRDGEDNMKVSAVEQFALAVFNPLGSRQGLALGTVTIRAGVVVNAFVAASVTAFGMTSQRGSAALRDGGNDTALRQGHGAIPLIGGPELAEHVGQFQPGAGHRTGSVSR
jgi:hypothetical protein